MLTTRVPKSAYIYLGIAGAHAIWSDLTFSAHVLGIYIDSTTEDGEKLEIRPYQLAVSSNFEAFWGTLLYYFPVYFLRGLLWPCDLLTFVPFSLMRRAKERRSRDAQI